MSSGQIFTKFAARSGYWTFDFVEYPSLVRGGHNTFYATVSAEEVFCTGNHVDLLIALNQETVTLHRDELNPGAGVIFDPDSFQPESIRGVKFWPVPLLKLAQTAGHRLMANTVALGAVAYLTGGNLKILKSVLTDVFASKKKEIIAGNHRAAELGYEFAKSKFLPLGDFLGAKKSLPRMLIGGNEAIALGSIAAGVKLASIYPMTPISSILHFLARFEKEAGIIYFQPEDEIAGISSAIGAAFAGVRSLVATSGGGFALMSESLSLAGITETPLVVIFGQRAGPATGIPTWTAQEDLLYALTAAQGEYPRILLAPGDAEECFYLTAEAFNLAETYQTPVVVLVDKFICEAHRTIPRLAFGRVDIKRGKMALSSFSPAANKKSEREIFPRYRLADDGISRRGFPREGRIVKVNSDEHNEFGLSEESIKNRNDQLEKRMKKTAGLSQLIPAPSLYGPAQAEVTLVGWGSTKGPILEAIKELKANFLYLNWLRPFPAQSVSRILAKAKKTLLIENNYQGQLGQWLKMQTGIEIKNKLLKYDGRQFYPEEIVKKIRSII